MIANRRMSKAIYPMVGHDSYVMADQMNGLDPQNVGSPHVHLLTKIEV